MLQQDIEIIYSIDKNHDLIKEAKMRYGKFKSKSYYTNENTIMKHIN